MFVLMFKWVFRAAGGAFPRLILAAGFVNVLALATPVFVLQVYDRVVFYNGRDTLYALVGGVMVAVAFDFLFRQARSRVVQSAAVRIDVNLGRTLFAKLLNLPLRGLEQRSTADWQSLFRDLQVVRNTIAGPPLINLIDLLFAVLFVFAIALIAPAVAWFVLLMVPVFVLLSAWSGFTIAFAAKRERNDTLVRDAVINELTSARQTVKALALEDTVQRLWSERHGQAVESSRERGRRGDRFQNLGYTLSMLTTIGITAVGAVAIMTQELTIGALIATNMLASRIFAPFVQLVGTWRAFSDARQAALRLSGLFDEVEEEERSAVAMARPEGAITLDRVNFAYADRGGFTIEDMSLGIGPRGLHALTGPSGSGKSTLLKLIAGLYRPQSGRVLIDGADLGQFVRADLARHVGLLPQEIVLFSGTIRDNLAMMTTEASDEEVRAAAERAGAHGFIADLPEGYGTDIGEWGGRLSGGQRQRIALSRAFMGDPSILLLDEPTSHLDPEAERQLAEVLAEMARDHTIVVVTHSDQVMSRADTIARIDGGRVTLAGPAKRILAMNQAAAPAAPRRQLGQDG